MAVQFFIFEKLQHKCGPSKSMDTVDSIGHTNRSEQPILNDMERKVLSWKSYWSCLLSCSLLDYNITLVVSRIEHQEAELIALLFGT